MRTVKDWLPWYNYINWVTRCDGHAARFVITLRLYTSWHIISQNLIKPCIDYSVKPVDLINTFLPIFKQWRELDSLGLNHTSTDRTLSKGYMLSLEGPNPSVYIEVLSYCGVTRLESQSALSRKKHIFQGERYFEIWMPCIALLKFTDNNLIGNNRN